MQNNMVGRRVKSAWYGIEGVIEQWEPLGHAMTDVLVRESTGRLCWYASHTLQPADDLGPLPSRRDAQEKARVRALESLEKIRAQHVETCRKGERWPGCEFGKVHVANMIDGAIASLKGVNS